MIPLDPSPVYFEKIIMLSIGAVYFTQSGVSNYQDFLQGIKIVKKGDSFDADYPAALECDGHPDWVIVPTQTTCESTAACSPDNLCGDGTACGLRNWNCAGSAAAAAAPNAVPIEPNEEAARILSPQNGHNHAGQLTGVCYYGGTQTPTANFSYSNCDPDFYQEYFDHNKNDVYYAIRYTPAAADLTEVNIDPYTSYSPSYEVIRQAQKQLTVSPTGLGATQLIDTMNTMYQYWWIYQGDLFGDSRVHAILADLRPK